MPVAALLAPELASVIGPALGVTAADTLATAGLTGALGAGLGAGSGAAFGALTGEGPGKGALSGALGGGLGAAGGPIGEAVGIGPAAGAAIGGAAGGFAGAEVTGGNPLIGAAEGAAPALVGALGGPSGGPGPSTTVTPMSGASGGASAVGAAPPVGTPTASVNPDPTAAGGPASAPITSQPLSSPSPGGGGKMALSGDWFSSGPGATLAADAPVFATGGNVGAPADTGIARILDRFASNPMALLSGGLLAAQAFKGNQPYPAEKAMTNLATSAGTTGATLSDYMFSGTLPPGAREAVDQATQRAKAETISRYSNLGLGNSTMLSDALHNIDQQAAAQSFQQADQLLHEGASYTQLSGNLYNAILSAQSAQDKQFMDALSLFATGLGGLGKPAAAAA